MLAAQRNQYSRRPERHRGIERIPDCHQGHRAAHRHGRHGHETADTNQSIRCGRFFIRRSPSMLERWYEAYEIDSNRRPHAESWFARNAPQRQPNHHADQTSNINRLQTAIAEPQTRNRHRASRQRTKARKNASSKFLVTQSSGRSYGREHTPGRPSKDSRLGLSMDSRNKIWDSAARREQTAQYGKKHGHGTILALAGCRRLC